MAVSADQIKEKGIAQTPIFGAKSRYDSLGLPLLGSLSLLLLEIFGKRSQEACAISGVCVD
jgi:hypothetical protein